jgi:biopolymer transport protein TolR
MQVGGNKGLKNEINVTPFVDVVLVLLIIFMVVTPMLQRGKAVRLPKSAYTEPKSKQAEPLVVTVASDGKLWISNDSFTEEGLQKYVVELLARNPGQKLLLKGDEDLTVGDIRKVMDLLRQAGAKSIAIGVEELRPR